MGPSSVNQWKMYPTPGQRVPLINVRSNASDNEQRHGQCYEQQ